jgi:hypothetical protein
MYCAIEEMVKTIHAMKKFILFSETSDHPIGSVTASTLRTPYVILVDADWFALHDGADRPITVLTNGIRLDQAAEFTLLDASGAVKYTKQCLEVSIDLALPEGIYFLVQAGTLM